MSYIMQKPMRLQQYLARAGVASRRAAEDIIVSGRVEVNGQVVIQLGTKVIPGKDLIVCDGAEIVLPDEQVTLMLNKPVGYVTTMTDPYGRKCVASLVPVQEYPGLFPVGRLDTDTSGLLLFTTDGHLGNALMHPRHHVDKTYRVRVKGQTTPEALQLLQSGVVLEDGITAPALAKIEKQTAHHTLLELTIHEGKNRQVRRMCEAVGFPVEELTRISYGSLVLGDLKPGEYKILSKEDRAALLA